MFAGSSTPWLGQFIYKDSGRQQKLFGDGSVITESSRHNSMTVVHSICTLLLTFDIAIKFVLL